MLVSMGLPMGGRGDEEEEEEDEEEEGAWVLPMYSLDTSKPGKEELT